MILKRTSISTTEPVAVSDQKLHMRVDSTSTAEDVLIGSYISAAREMAENKLRRALIPQSWRLVINDFPASTVAIPLLYPPLSTAASAVTITYTKNDTLASSTTVPSTAYTVDRDSEPCRIFPSGTNIWATDVNTARNSVVIDYLCGYASSGEVPPGIRTWIMIKAAALYENRESLIVSQYSGAAAIDLPRSFVDGLLDPYAVEEV